MSIAPVEIEFNDAMKEIYRRAKAEAGYNATVFLRMLSERGPLQTAHFLINLSTPSDGFTALWQRNPLATVSSHGQTRTTSAPEAPDHSPQ